MILKGSQRGGAKQLAGHLLKQVENEHVEVHEIRGFVAEDLKGALHEAYAISQGTRCKQFLFSLSLNPPEKERVPVEVFEKALQSIEQKLGLENQPRALVFHEKEGRRHAHCVWSRINAEEMKAINLSHFKLKLRDVSKALYLEHGWQMPRGLVDSAERDPSNFSRAEWQQAKRAKLDPKDLKAMFQECWAVSDSRQAFASALSERGFYLAQGDRRGFVAVDYRGEVYAISKWVGIRAKEVAARLGDPKSLPSVDNTKAAIADRMGAQVRRYIQEAERESKQNAARLAFQRADLSQRHQEERHKLKEFQKSRWLSETKRRSARLSRGVKGVWERITGKYGKIRSQNEAEAYRAHLRDRVQKQSLVDRQLQERQTFQQEVRRVREGHFADRAQLHEDVALYIRMGEREPPDLTEHFEEAAEKKDESKTRESKRRRDRGLDIEM